MRVLLVLLALASAQLPDERFNRPVFSGDPMPFGSNWETVIEVTSHFDGTSPTFDFNFIDLDDDYVINATDSGAHEIVYWELSNIVEEGSGVDGYSAWLEYTDNVGHFFRSVAGCNTTCSGFIYIPSLVPAGTYEGKAWLSDNAGNAREVDLPSLEVISPLGDLVAPKFITEEGVSLRFVNQSSEYRFVDVYNGVGRVDISVDVNDSDGDLDFVMGTYAEQNDDYYGGDVFEFDLDCWHPNNTEPYVFRCLGSLQFGRDTRPNNFVITSMTAFDTVGNSEIWNLNNFDVDFEVKNEMYTTMRPPTCKRTVIDNNKADTTEEDDMVRVTLNCDWYDGNSDRNFAQVEFESPEVMIDGVASRVSTRSNIFSFDNNNEWEHNVRFNQWVPSGDWTLKRVFLFTDSGDANEYTSTAVVEMSSSSTGESNDDADDGDDGDDDVNTGGASRLSSSFIAIISVVAAFIFDRLF